MGIICLIRGISFGRHQCHMTANYKFDVFVDEQATGKIEGLKLNIDDHDVVLINVHGPNNNDASF